jgi:hypothetical protein
LDASVSPALSVDSVRSHSSNQRANVCEERGCR